MSDIDSPKLQNSVFKRQAKPKVTIHGDLWYEGKAVTPALWDGRDGEKICKRETPFPIRWTPAGETLRDRLGKGEGSTAIGKHFNLGESTVRAIKKNEAAIRKSVISGTKLSTKFASYTRDVLLERTERAIAIWIEEQVQRRIPCATADEGAAKIFPEELAKIIEDGDYSADQVFNADETGLYWKKLPNRTYIAKYEKTASGHKASKDRVTLLLCSNASGDRMLKPLLINKSLRPRALKGKDLKQLPVHWMANRKSWMTTAIFKEWFNNCFVPEVEAYMKEKSLDFKVLLIVDNAASHPQLEHPNLQLVFLPPNTTQALFSH
ncbi:tigger transposable element-derived protein 1 [Trichonephila clavipes]|uniref:Tigger transposable element-derived protein 1 n=1 Tax=Trichonephila clavipes TaxID=2585209 RepID=A0A8X6V940_TRICX|nr:tigger transposable element-derived protein 1 [Trichonephila clavipes]